MNYADLPQLLSTSKAARLLHVVPATVAHWVDQGKLKGGRTAGGHRRLSVPDLVAFLRRQQLPVPRELHLPPRRLLMVNVEAPLAEPAAQAISRQHPELEFLTAGDAFTAGELIGSLKPDVVVLDMGMAATEGMAICKRICSRPAEGRAEVIAITADGSAQAEAEIRSCGARACLVKPVDPRRLVLEVEAALGS